MTCTKRADFFLPLGLHIAAKACMAAKAWLALIVLGVTLAALQGCAHTHTGPVAYCPAPYYVAEPVWTTAPPMSSANKSPSQASTAQRQRTATQPAEKGQASRHKLLEDDTSQNKATKSKESQSPIWPAEEVSTSRKREHRCDGGFCANDATVGYNPTFGDLPPFYGHGHSPYAPHHPTISTER